MLTLSEENIFLDLKAPNKQAALRIAADALIKGGYVKADFYQAMLAREKEFSTYIGSGVALPHCTKNTIDQVIKTGCQIFQFPGGVSWGGGKIAFIVVAVAAKKHEHIDVLSDIADMLDNEIKTTLLSRASTAAEFIELLQKKIDSQ